MSESLPDEHDYLLFTPDSRLFIALASGVAVWQAETWRKLSGTEGVRMSAWRHSFVTASSDGKLLAFCDHEEVWQGFTPKNDERI